MGQQAPPGSQEYKPGLHGPLSRVVYESGRWIGRGRFRQRLQHLCRRGSREHGPGAWAWWQAGPLREGRMGLTRGGPCRAGPSTVPGSSVASRPLLSGTAAESLSRSPGREELPRPLLTQHLSFLFIFGVLLTG